MCQALGGQEGLTHGEREEIARREQDRQTSAMMASTTQVEALTRVLVRLTWVLTVLTSVAMVAAVVSVVRQF